MRIITDRMLMAVKDSTQPVESLDFSEFRKFLDLNPGIRLIISESLKPGLWTIPETKPGVTNAGGLSCVAPTRS